MEKKYCKKEKKLGKRKTGRWLWRPRGRGKGEGELGRKKRRRKGKERERKKSRAEEIEHSGREHCYYSVTLLKKYGVYHFLGKS